VWRAAILGSKPWMLFSEYKIYKILCIDRELNHETAKILLEAI